MGKNNVSNTSVSLEFGNTEDRGLIVPYVENKSGIEEEGTIIYDVSDYKVKYLKNNNTWVSLSEDDGTSATIGTVDLSIQGSDKTENTTSKVAIGSVDGANGILVLTDNNKAMVLPKVASPHLRINKPAAGMMVYDTNARQLAVYNGTSWSFWKP
ncbi:hypothetical protein [Chryseobacterium sp. FH1]|uniref:hypothetical protein n=1 Tax=Chryseobacterium sp. FH1 TaxID=1233951 RepID=UPI001E48F911|nr:hypothetical protein [Chryseobacterium sp. FH1]